MIRNDLITLMNLYYPDHPDHPTTYIFFPAGGTETDAAALRLVPRHSLLEDTPARAHIEGSHVPPFLLLNVSHLRAQKRKLQAWTNPLNCHAALFGRAVLLQHWQHLVFSDHASLMRAWTQLPVFPLPVLHSFPFLPDFRQHVRAAPVLVPLQSRAVRVTDAAQASMPQTEVLALLEKGCVIKTEALLALETRQTKLQHAFKYLCHTKVGQGGRRGKGKGGKGKTGAQQKAKLDEEAFFDL